MSADWRLHTLRKNNLQIQAKLKHEIFTNSDLATQNQKVIQEGLLCEKKMFEPSARPDARQLKQNQGN